MGARSEDPILYSFRRCPFAMRARLAIDIAGVQCELREVVLANKPAPMLEASPKGTVPVWIDPNAGVIDQSLAIMHHVLTQGGCLQYLPDPDPLHVTNQWVTACDGPFKHHLDRYKYASRYVEAPKTDGEPPDDGGQALIHRAYAAGFIQTLDAHLRDHPFLSGQHQGWADLAIAPFMRQFRVADVQWFDERDWVGVHAWLGTFLTSERFARIMRKFRPWQEGTPGAPFP